MRRDEVVEGLSLLGLSKIDSEIYLYVSAHSGCRAGDIIRTLKFNRSKVYDSLNKLAGAGLVSYVDAGGVMKYSSTGFSRLKSLQAELHGKVDSAMGYLENLITKTPIRMKVSMIEGFRGYVSVKDDFYSRMDKGEEVLILGAPPLVYENLDPYISRFHERRIADGVNMRIIYNQDARMFRKPREKWKHTEVRYLPRDVSPAWIELFGENVMLPIFTDQIYTVSITDPTMARGFRHYFDVLWENTCTAKKRGSKKEPLNRKSRK